jgi:hypothetical protein
VKKHLFYYALTVILLPLLIAACSPVKAMTQLAANTPTTGQAPTLVTFSDPFAYCDNVGAIDQPDARYTGEKVPDRIIQGYIKAAGLTGTTEPMDMLRQATVWRCMNKQVYVCNFGANLPCNSKANTDKSPTQAMTDYCKDNPDSDFIPMSVTGHSTIYSWHCVKDTPELLDQVDQVDAAAYLERIWYQIQPGS